MKASCGKPGTEFASLLTSGLPICIPWCCMSDMSWCCIGLPGLSGEFVIRRSNVEPTPIPRARLGPFSSDVALPCRSIPMPRSMSRPAGIPFRRVIGPTLEDIWFIMWWGRWQCSIQSPGLLATNSTSRDCATPTSTVFPGPHVDWGCRPPSVPVTTKVCPCR